MSKKLFFGAVILAILASGAFAIEYSKAIAELSTSLNALFQQGLGYTVKYKQ